MRLTIAGLGYVGAVTAACLSDAGHDVTVVDINATKVEQLNRSESPILEAGVSELIRSGVAAGRLHATTDLRGGCAGATATIVCVGTPTASNGDVSLRDVETVVAELGDIIGESDTWQFVLITSTVPPGTVRTQIIPELEKLSGKRCGTDFGVGFSPEFLREGTAVHDFREPSKTVIGASDSRALETFRSIFSSIAQDVTVTSIETAEMVKFTDNAWHALKVAFSNEIGRVSAAHGVNSNDVMEIFKLDQRQNLGPTYLSPGFAFGGSCLPKDLRTLTYRARTNGVTVPVLESILPSNRNHLEFAMNMIEAYDAQRVALLGLAFKSGTDDLRESPYVDLAEWLLGKGYELAIHDDSVNLERLLGSNLGHIRQRLPHIASHLDGDLTRVVMGADLVIIGQRNPSYASILQSLGDHQRAFDLSGVAAPDQPDGRYRGLMW